jgi:hypothetical protein
MSKLGISIVAGLFVGSGVYTLTKDVNIPIIIIYYKGNDTSAHIVYNFNKYNIGVIVGISAFITINYYNHIK